MNIRIGKIALTTLVSCAVFTGCASDQPLTKRQTGTAVGAVTGGILGHQVDGDKGRFVGAAVGALAGNAVGRYMDDQQRELEERLTQEQQNQEIEISRLGNDTLKLNLSSEVSFDVNSASIKTDFRDSLNKVADVLADYPSTAIHIAGHTDSSGSDQYNYQLSLRRATSVRSYLSAQGVSEPRTRTVGYGESRPVADNSSRTGRQQNRRVEIFLKPIVQGQESSAFQPPS